MLARVPYTVTGPLTRAVGTGPAQTQTTHETMSTHRYGTTTPGHITAYCWMNGVTRFTRTNQQLIPEGTLPILSGPKKQVRSVVTAKARIAHDGKTLLVPGLPEHKFMKEDPVDVLLRHTNWMLTAPSGKGLYKTPKL